MIPNFGTMQWESSSFGSSAIPAFISTTSQSVEIYKWSASLSQYTSSASSSLQINSLWHIIAHSESAAVSYSIAPSNILETYIKQNQIYIPGILDTIYIPYTPVVPPVIPLITGSSVMSASLTNTTFTYYLVSASFMRQGIYVNARSGSPQISLEAVSGSPSEIWPGDMWYVDTTNYSGSDGGLRFADYSRITTGSYPISRFVFSRIGESSSIQVSNRFLTADSPISSTLGITSVVVDNWLVTVNKNSGSLGSGWRNETWGGGIYMPDQNTVAVYGNKNFVTSGTISASLYLGFMESASYALTASYALSAPVGGNPDWSNVQNKPTGLVSSSVQINTGSFSGSFTGAFQGLGSGITGVISSSYSTTSQTASILRNTTFNSSVAPTITYQTISSGTQHITLSGLYGFTAQFNSGDHQTMSYGGQLYWYTGSTNATSSDEIIVHRSGINPGSSSFYFRTLHQSAGSLLLQFASSHNYVGSGTLTLTLVKLI